MNTQPNKPVLTYALGQIDVVPGRPDSNSARIIKEAIAAAARGVQVIVFPEMCVSGYLLGDKFNSASFADDIAVYNQRIVDALAGYDIVVIFGTFAIDRTKVNENGRYRMYNVAIVAHKGEVIQNDAGLPYAIKSLLPNYRIFDDARYFTCLRKLAMEMEVSLKDVLKPFSVTIDGVLYKLGVMLCEDMWDIDYSQKPAEILASNGAETIINLSASNWSWRKNAKRHQVVKDLVAKIGLPFIYVNNVGSQNNGKNFVPFDGSSTVYSAEGNIVCLCEMYADQVQSFTLTADAPTVQQPASDDVAEMFAAIKADTLGFLRTAYPKHRQKVIIGLSGGMDSMLSAAFFTHLLGPENVVVVNLPYQDYNSAETKSIAQKGVSNLGLKLRVVPIDDMVSAYCQTNNIKEGTPQHKTAQASMRYQVLAAIASQEGGLIISNGNKTELAFGYATLIGDLRGYFAPWVDCVKGEVYQLADYINREVFGWEVIPKECFDIAPMDELTKTGAGERSDPFDYGHINRVGYHDAMVRSLTEVHAGPDWFLAAYLDGTLEQKMLLSKGRLQELFPTVEAFIADLEAKLLMFSGAIHKRVQSVPGAHFSRSSFGWDFREYLPVVADGQEVLEVLYPLRYQALKAEALAV
jgi:NAD+ synthase (glutamine-hydrolysing)